jgi:hypothetical protein
MAVKQDPEIAAMSTISAALAGLEDEASRARVLEWAGKKYNVKFERPSTSRRQSGSLVDRADEVEGQTGQGDYEHFADLFDEVDPQGELDKVITAAYWLQVVQKQTTWQSGPVNSLLKDAGHGIGNVTAVLTRAQERRPALVRQISKSGKTRQARKTYKLTTVGMRHVRNTSTVADAETDDDEE